MNMLQYPKRQAPVNPGRELAFEQCVESAKMNAELVCALCFHVVQEGAGFRSVLHPSPDSDAAIPGHEVIARYVHHAGFWRREDR